LAFTGIFAHASAQQQHNTDSSNLIAHDEFLRLLLPPAEVEGRANLFANWRQGAVFLSQGRFASGITFNYDMLNHTLLVLVDGEEFSLNPIAVDSILMANSSYVLVNPIILNGLDSELLLLRVYNGLHLSLFRKTLAEVTERDVKTSSSTELVYVRKDDIQIDQDQTYFLLNKATNEFSEFQGKKKELKNWENGDQLLTFVKDQDLDLKNEADLIQVVQYYERLTYP
jgi:hypothetical protein